jgi:hypothetical protein
MSTLIPQVSIVDFSKLNISELKRLSCCEIYDGEDYLFTFIRPGTDFARARSENIGQLSNSVAGESLEAIKGVPNKPAKRKYRKHKHRVKK